MGNTKAIGTAYSDQDLTGSTLTDCIMVGGSSAPFNPAGGKVWYADSAVAQSGDGTNWTKAFGTIAAAVAAASTGDVIYIRGSFSEAVTMSVAGVTIIGAGPVPKSAQWTSAADTSSLTIAANYCRVQNIYFKPPARSAGTPTAIKLNGANWAYIVGNRFQGQTASYNAIYSPAANSDNVHIIGNEFYYMNTATYGAAILGVDTGGLSYSAWQIKDNVFSSCVTAININGRACVLTGNSVAEYGINASGAVAAVLALGIDLSGTSSGGNVVWNNQLGGTYSATLYVVGASGDQWAGNFNVLTGGVTAANPA